MKLLLDQNLSFRFLDQLSARFPGSTQTRIACLDRASDLQVWEYAKQNDLTVVTKDMDFYEAHSETVEPLPFHSMGEYPYGPGIRYPHLNYRLNVNTRYVNGRGNNTSFRFRY